MLPTVFLAQSISIYLSFLKALNLLSTLKALKKNHWRSKSDGTDETSSRHSSCIMYFSYSKFGILVLNIIQSWQHFHSVQSYHNYCGKTPLCRKVFMGSSETTKRTVIRVLPSLAMQIMDIWVEWLMLAKSFVVLLVSSYCHPSHFHIVAGDVSRSCCCTLK